MLWGEILLGSSQNTHFSSVVGLWVYFSFTFKFLHVFYNEYVLQLEWRKNNLHIKNENQGSHGYLCFLEKHRPLHQYALASLQPMHPPSGHMEFLHIPSICLPPSTSVLSHTPLCACLLSPAGRWAPRGHGLYLLSHSCDPSAQHSLWQWHPKGSIGI
uniref:Uncharacterized protein n=1 Tax=Myotis myotis TaxID=51298 RepID=A0A7J8AN44_MYOMY|nr:hypothetical protein mMyoMyo1_008111 [Myotis myotis]